MSESRPIQSFGIHQATFRSLSDGFMSTVYILGDVIPDFSQEVVMNRGGSSAFPWSAASGEANAEITLTVKQYSKGVFRFFQPYEPGSIVEQPTGDVAGDVSTATNIIGTSVIDAATGIATIVADPAGTLMFGEYIVKCPTNGDTVDLYSDVNLDGQVYVDDTLKLTASPLTVPSASSILSNGLQLNGGSGVIAMSAGDVAKLNVRPVNNYALEHYIGKKNACQQEFALTIASEVICGGEKMIRVINLPRCIASGGGALSFPYKDWASFEATITVLQDQTVGYVAKQSIIGR